MRCQRPANVLRLRCVLYTEKTPPLVTLYGDDYLSYDLSRRADTVVSNRDSASLYFKTSQPNACLFYTGTHPVGFRVPVLEAVASPGFWSKRSARTLASLEMDWRGPRPLVQKDFFKAV